MAADFGEDIPNCPCVVGWGSNVNAVVFFFFVRRCGSTKTVELYNRGRLQGVRFVTREILLPEELMFHREHQRNQVSVLAPVGSRFSRFKIAFSLVSICVH